MEETEVLSTEEEAVTPEVSMDETIANTLKEIEARGEVQEEVTDEPESGRVRDEKGRFAAKQEAAPETPVEVAEEAPTTSVPPELQKLGLRKEEAEAIAANPMALQAFMRRSEEMHKGLDQYREKAQFGAQIEQAIQPYMATINAMGAHPAMAVQRLFSADHALRYGTPQQKTNMLMQIAKDYGVSMDSINEYQAEQPYVDPQVQALQTQVQQLQALIAQQDQKHNQQWEWQERQAHDSAIARFSQDPANTHFESVRGEMADLLQANLATDLKDAYEKAIYLNPTIRAAVLAQQQAAAEEKRKADAIQKAQVAKKAASVNLPRKGLVPASRPVGSMEDTIRETAQRLGIM